MILKDLNSITIQDIIDLKDNRANETKILEYKKELKLVKDQDRKEFLARYILIR